MRGRSRGREVEQPATLNCNSLVPLVGVVKESKEQGAVCLKREAGKAS